VLKGDRPTGEKADAFVKALREHVSEQLGAIARPDDIRFADNLPKTRSGKIMRRLLRAIARNEDITQDLSTLENPAIIEQLRGNETAPPVKAAVPKAPAKRKAASPKPKTKPKTKSKAKARKAAPKRKVVAKRKVTAKKKAAKRNAKKRAPARRKK